MHFLFLVNECFLEGEHMDDDLNNIVMFVAEFACTLHNFLHGMQFHIWTNIMKYIHTDGSVDCF